MKYIGTFRGETVCHGRTKNQVRNLLRAELRTIHSDKYQSRFEHYGDFAKTQVWGEIQEQVVTLCYDRGYWRCVINGCQHELSNAFAIARSKAIDLAESAGLRFVEEESSPAFRETVFSDLTCPRYDRLEQRLIYSS